MSQDRPLPSIIANQMREVDRLMIQGYGIKLIQMMENAGSILAQLVADFAEGASANSVLVMAGKGNNGGGGLVAARHLSNMGRRVRVSLAAPMEELRDLPSHQASILQEMGVEVRNPEPEPSDWTGESFGDANIVIDALIGYSLTGAPRGATAALIEMANASGKPIISLDVPSGVDAGSGGVYDPAIQAAATLTLALPKTGFAAAEARERLGELYLGDISVPAGLYRRLGLEVGSPFAHGRLVALSWTANGWAPARGG